MEGFKKGPWSEEEDRILIEFVRVYGPGDWSCIRSKGLLPRTGKSCRLRWVNKLRPGLKSRIKFSPEEERIVLEMQARIGNKWSSIAKLLPGRTDNDVKNFWSIRKKRLARLEKYNARRKEAGFDFPDNTPSYVEDLENIDPNLSNKAGSSNDQSSNGALCVNQSYATTTSKPEPNTSMFDQIPFDPLTLNQPCFSDPFMFEPLPDFFGFGPSQMGCVQPAFDDLTADVLALFEQPQLPRSKV